MLKLTINEIKDFQICERLYDYRHAQKMPETIPSRTLNTLKFESTLKNIVHFFFYKKQAGITPSYTSLLNRWEKLWFPKGTTSYDIIHEQHESLYGNSASMTTKAASALLNVVEKFSDPEIIPIGIDADFIVPIVGDVYLEDKFDLIYYKNNKTHVVKWSFNHNMKNDFLHVAEMAGMYRAFLHQYGEKILQAEFGYYDLVSSKPQFINYDITPDYIDALVFWCSSIEKENIFPSRRGLTTYCKSCPYDKPCSKWTPSIALKEREK
jgi:hypothetical protein